MFQNGSPATFDSETAVQRAARLETHYRLLTSDDTTALCRSIEAVEVSLVFARLREMAAGIATVCDLEETRDLLHNRLVIASDHETRTRPVWRSCYGLVTR